MVKGKRLLISTGLTCDKHLLSIAKETWDTRCFTTQVLSQLPEVSGEECFLVCGSAGCTMCPVFAMLRLCELRPCTPLHYCSSPWISTHRYMHPSFIGWAVQTAALNIHSMLEQFIERQVRRRWGGASSLCLFEYQCQCVFYYVLWSLLCDLIS